MDKIKSRLNNVEEQISEFNNKSIKIIQTNAQRNEKKTLKERKKISMICEIVRRHRQLESQKDMRDN